MKYTLFFFPSIFPGGFDTPKKPESKLETSSGFKASRFGVRGELKHLLGGKKKTHAATTWVSKSRPTAGEKPQTLSTQVKLTLKVPHSALSLFPREYGGRKAPLRVFRDTEYKYRRSHATD